MGTRNLTACFYQGEYRIAQYGQWDGYPDGGGVKTLEFARDKLDREKFLPKLLKVRDLTEADRARVNDTKDWAKYYPHLSRDAGADILGMVQAADDGIALQRNINFAGDSLMCEWAYVLDFDKNTLEAFRGFNHTKLDPSERFANIPTDGSDYQPVKFMKSWPLDALPTNEQFVTDLTPPEEDEEAA